MWYKNIAGRFFGLVTKHACDRRTDGQNYDSQDRASIAASRGKNLVLLNVLKQNDFLYHGRSFPIARAYNICCQLYLSLYRDTAQLPSIHRCRLSRGRLHFVCYMWGL